MKVKDRRPEYKSVLLTFQSSEARARFHEGDGRIQVEFGLTTAYALAKKLGNLPKD